MHPDFEKVLYSEEQLRSRVAELGAQITKDYADAEDLLVISVLRGASIYMADLVREIKLPLEMDFMVSELLRRLDACHPASSSIIKDLDASEIEGQAMC